MNNTEQKKEHAKKIEQKIKEELKSIEGNYSLQFEAINDDTIYYHPVISIEDYKIKCQCDLNKSNYYAIYLSYEDFEVEFKNTYNFGLKYLIRIIKDRNTIQQLKELKKEINEIEKAKDYLTTLINIKKKYFVKNSKDIISLN